jgi:uncharacterized membrane protein YdjX (TVP38/TMEM64 family)
MSQFLSHLLLSDDESREELRRWGPWVGFALILLALCLAWFLLPLREWMDALQAWFKGRGAWGVAIFALVLFVATFLPMPDWPLPIVAGYVYGIWAMPLVYVGVAVPSVLAFLAARHLARDRIRAFLAKRPKYRSIDKAVGAGGWQVVALLRLSPMVPFNLQNYALGVTAISFREYLIGTLSGITPGVAIYVYFGIFGYGLHKGPGMLDWVLLGAGALATIALGIPVTRKSRQVFETSARHKR